MIIAGVASALPQHKYDQRVLLQALQKHWGPKVDTRCSWNVCRLASAWKRGTWRFRSKNTTG